MEAIRERNYLLTQPLVLLLMHNTERNIALLCNPTKKKALRMGNDIVACLRKKKISFSLFTAYWPTVWDAFTEAWIVGGDGTANVFINHYPDFQLPFAIFPGGSGNDLHALVYGSIPLSAQIEQVLQGTPHPVDAGVCNGDLFLNGIGLGFDGVVIKSMLGTAKRGGSIAYFLAVLRHLFSYQEKRCTLLFDGKKIVQDCFMVVAANGTSYGGGFKIAPKADIADGVLDLMIVGNINAVQRMRYLPVVQRGEHLHLPFVKYEQTNAVIIKCPAPVSAHRDGEYFTADTFEIRCSVKRFSLLW